MKIVLRTLIVIAAILAILAPAMYGFHFGAFADWSALVDFALVISCVALAFAAFRNLSVMLWLTAFTIVTVFAVSGFFHRFRDSGESGPLPFEWLNSYFLQAFPLLVVAILTRVFLTNKKSEQGADGDAEEAV